MKLFIRLIAFVLLAAMLLNVAGCNIKNDKKLPQSKSDNTSEALNMLKIDAEIFGESQVVAMISAFDEEVFDEKIASDSIECHVHYIGAEDYSIPQIDNVMYQTSQKIGLNFIADDDIDSVVIKVKKSGTLNGKEYVGSSDNIIHSGMSADEAILASIAEVKEMLKKGVFETGMSFVSYGISAYNILSLAGVFKNPQKSQMEVIHNQVEQLSLKIDSLDKKLDTMYDNLKIELDKIKNTTKQTLRNTYAQRWSEFETHYIDTSDGIGKQITKFNNKYSENFCEYIEDMNGTFSIYYDTDGNVTMPVSDIHKEGTQWMSIDGTVIDEKATVTFEIDKDTFAKTNSLKIKSIDNEQYMNSLHDELTDVITKSDDKSVNENADKYAEDIVASVSIAVIMQTMNEKDENGYVADSIIDSFELYSKKICDKKVNPIEAYHNLIYTDYNFQSEAKDDIEAFNSYMLSKSAEYCGYAELAAKFGSVLESKKNKIRTNANNIVTFFDNNSGLVEEKDGMQYSYVTKSYIAGTQYTASFHEGITCHLRSHLFYVSGVYDRHNFSMGWDKAQENIISTTDLQDIYAVYSVLYMNGYTTLSFRDYFISSLCINSVYSNEIINMNAEGVISGSHSETRDFPTDGSVTLRCYSDVFNGQHPKAQVSSPVEYFTKNKDFKIGTEFTSSDAETAYFKVHSALYADVLDLQTNKFKSDTPLLYAAMYIEDHSYFIVDELWEFGGIGNISNKEKWSSIEYNEYGDASNYPPLTYISELNYTLDANAVFWAIVNVD